MASENPWFTIYGFRSRAKVQDLTMLQERPGQGILKSTMGSAAVLIENSIGTEGIGFANTKKEPEEAHFPPFC